MPGTGTAGSAYSNAFPAREVTERERRGARAGLVVRWTNRTARPRCNAMRRLAAALSLGFVIPAGARPAVLERVVVVEDGRPVVGLHVSGHETSGVPALAPDGDLPA